MVNTLEYNTSNLLVSLFKPTATNGLFNTVTSDRPVYIIVESTFMIMFNIINLDIGGATFDP